MKMSCYQLLVIRLLVSILYELVYRDNSVLGPLGRPKRIKLMDEAADRVKLLTLICKAVR